MNKLFIITIILLFQSFPSYGNLNGKNLICECIGKEDCFKENQTRSYRLYSFDDNLVKKLTIYRVGEQFKIGNYEGVKYEIDHSLVSWNRVSLDRKSLKISTYFLYGNSFVQIKLQCKVFNNKEFKEKITSMKKDFQKRYDNKKKGNKI